MSFIEEKFKVKRPVGERFSVSAGVGWKAFKSKVDKDRDYYIVSITISVSDYTDGDQIEIYMNGIPIVKSSYITGVTEYHWEPKDIVGDKVKVPRNHALSIRYYNSSDTLSLTLIVDVERGYV